MSSTSLTFAPASPISYKNLDSNSKEIRLLEVEPGAGDDILICKLKHVSLLQNSTPIYETISYCWGAPRDPTSIELDSRVVSVTPSSEAAVRRMRLRDEPRVLWVDAICINQSSTSERSEQVAIMSSIYSLASRNLVYLGEDEAGLAERAIHSLQKLLSEMRAATSDFTSLFPVLNEEETGLRLYSDQGFQSDVDFDALVGLFALPWFQRLWVQQEVALASSNTCHWGEFEFDLSDVTRAGEWLDHMADYLPTTLHESHGRTCAATMFATTDSLYKSSFRPGTLAKFMSELRLSIKTEPRDGVYALLGLLTKKATLEDRWRELLEVDYSKPVSDVVRDATRYAFEECQDFSPLLWEEASTEQRDAVGSFPSWVVRVDSSIEYNDLAAIFSVPNSACKGLQAPSLFGDVSHGPGILLGQGFIADRVVEVTPVFCEDIFISVYKLHLWLMGVKEMAMRRCSYAAGRHPSQVYLDIAHTLAAGTNRTGRPAQREEMMIVTDYIAKLGSEEDPFSPEEALGVHNDLERTAACSARRFFVTQNGRMGIGPAAMRPGDVVAVLRGGPIPLVLGEGNDGYTYIGGSYVHGIMDGEAVREWAARNEPEMMFPIR